MNGSAIAAIATSVAVAVVISGACVDAYLKGGKAPVFKYHRRWTQADIAIGNASYGWLFPDDDSSAVAATKKTKK
jgi:hypothetical protein